MDTKHLALVIGRKAISDKIGVGLTAVGEAVTSGAFPSSWYAGIVELAQSRGIAVPARLFRWKGSVCPDVLDRAAASNKQDAA